MAEASGVEESLPPKGRVRAVRQQWSVHEDGALAYNVQQQEIDEHYGLNRFHRRTVRGDIPIAKIVQSEEELQQQEERMMELEALKAQAEEDERMARQVSRRLQHDIADAEAVREFDDEEIARQLQEKEKRRYERHLEKKREKMLREERRVLEAALARDSEEARLAVNSDTGSAALGDSIESLETQGVNLKRVTPGGRIEDEGDFSDFYKLPDELDELSRMEIQATQDEELAWLLQEQEHKRSKAEVDQDRLRQIEQQDERLARVMQEQERIRLKKARQKHREKKEAQRQQQAEQLPLGASANTMNQEHQHRQGDPPQSRHQQQQNAQRYQDHNAEHQQMPQQRLHQHSPESDRSPIAAAASSPMAIPSGHTRYRRNSYTQAFDSPPSPPHSQPPPRRRDTAPQQGVVQKSSAKPGLSQSQSVPYSSYPREGMSTLESARRIAAGDPERIQALEDSNSNSGPRQPRGGGGHTSTIDILRGHHHEPVTYSQPYQPQVQLELSNGASGAPQGHHSRQNRHYSSEEDERGDDGGFNAGSSGYNIAAAIDPTYQRRHPELASQEGQPGPVVPFSRSLPQADGELEWDPGLRGSLRKTKAPIHANPESKSYDPSGASWQPVQGQRRGDGTKSGKSRGDSGKKDKGNCKQQ